MMQPFSTMTREELQQTYEQLSKAHEEKQKRWQEKTGLGPEVGCLTREGCLIVAMIPSLTMHGLWPPASFSLHDGVLK